MNFRLAGLIVVAMLLPTFFLAFAVTGRARVSIHFDDLHGLPYHDFFFHHDIGLLGAGAHSRACRAPDGASNDGTLGATYFGPYPRTYAATDRAAYHGTQVDITCL